MRQGFCGNCGAEIMTGEKFCQNCGEKVIESSIQSVVNQNVSQSTKKPVGKIIVYIITGILLLGIVVNVMERIDAKRYIARVKTGEFQAYPDMEIGEGFEEYFINPEWEYVEKEGEDDAPVGSYVNFRGKCSFADEMVRVKIRFTFTSENEFEITYMSIDGVEVGMYTNIMTHSLLEDVYNDYMGW